MLFGIDGPACTTTRSRAAAVYMDTFLVFVSLGETDWAISWVIRLAVVATVGPGGVRFHLVSSVDGDQIEPVRGGGGNFLTHHLSLSLSLFLFLFFCRFDWRVVVRVD